MNRIAGKCVINLVKESYLQFQLVFFSKYHNKVLLLITLLDIRLVCIKLLMTDKHLYYPINWEIPVLCQW